MERERRQRQQIEPAECSIENWRERGGGSAHFLVNITQTCLDIGFGLLQILMRKAWSGRGRGSSHEAPRNTNRRVVCGQKHDLRGPGVGGGKKVHLEHTCRTSTGPISLKTLAPSSASSSSCIRGETAVRWQLGCVGWGGAITTGYGSLRVAGERGRKAQEPRGGGTASCQSKG